MRRRCALPVGSGMNALLVAALERDREVFVQPAAGNAGTAIGAVLHTAASVYGQTATVGLRNLCLGPEYSAEEIKQVLENCKLRFKYLLTSDELIETAVQALNNNQIVAWVHGRMEFGPRALGNRSILGVSTQSIFYGESEYLHQASRAVPQVCRVGSGRARGGVLRSRSECPISGDGGTGEAAASEDVRRGGSRPGFGPGTYGFASRIIRCSTGCCMKRAKRTGLPVLYNTSFNLFGDPLVCTPRDAARSFYSSGIDAMFVG